MALRIFMDDLSEEREVQDTAWGEEPSEQEEDKMQKRSEV
jgi:hypothetical protein